MDLTYLLVAVAILALPAILSALFAGSGDTKVVLGAPAPVPKRAADKRARAAALRGQVQALVMQRRYTDAVKLVQSASGVPLKKAQEIVATLQRAAANQSGRRTTATRPAPPSPTAVSSASQVSQKLSKLMRERTGLGL